MKILRIIGILAIVVALVLGGTASAFAKGPTNPNAGGGKGSPGKSGLFGTVDFVDGPDQDGNYVITLLTDDGVVEVTINEEDTKYKMPGVPGPKPDLATFVGELDGEGSRRIAALVESTGEDTPAIALRVMLMPNPNNERVHGHRVGVVVEGGFIEGESITIANKKGEETTFEGMLPDIKLLPAGTDPVDGDFVTVIYSRNPGTVDFVVKGIVVHPAIPNGWSEGDDGVELALIMNESEVSCGNPEDETTVGSVTLEADNDEGQIIIEVEVSLTEVADPTTYAVSLVDYGENWSSECEVLDSTSLGTLNEDGKLETVLAREPGTYYVQIVLEDADDGDDVWDFITEVIVIELAVEE